MNGCMIAWVNGCMTASSLRVGCRSPLEGTREDRAKSGGFGCRSPEDIALARDVACASPELWDVAICCWFASLRQSVIDYWQSLESAVKRLSCWLKLLVLARLSWFGGGVLGRCHLLLVGSQAHLHFRWLASVVGPAAGMQKLTIDY
jgi:hypothetical protein